MKLWEKKTEEELKDAMMNSYTYKELAQKLGYSYPPKNFGEDMRKMAEKFNIDIYHYGKVDLRGQTFGLLKVLDYDKSKEKIGETYFCASVNVEK